MATSVNYLMVETDWCVPVGSDVGADDDCDAATTVGWGALDAGAPLLPIRAMSWDIILLITAKRSGEVEPDEVVDYKSMVRQAITVW